MENTEPKNLSDETLEKVSGGFEGPLSKTGACPTCKGRNVSLCWAQRGEGIQYRCNDCESYFYVLDD